MAESLQAMKLDPIQPLGIGHVVFASADQSYMAFDTTKHQGCEVAATKHLACTSERANAYDKILRDGDWPFGLHIGDIWGLWGPTRTRFERGLVQKTSGMQTEKGNA